MTPDNARDRRRFRLAFAFLVIAALSATFYWTNQAIGVRQESQAAASNVKFNDDLPNETQADDGVAATPSALQSSPGGQTNTLQNAEVDERSSAGPETQTIQSEMALASDLNMSQTASAIAAYDSAPKSWGLDRIDQRTSTPDGIFQPDGSGRGVDIYIFDTGIRQTHAELNGRVLGGKSFVPSEPDPFDDCGNHGTKVASAAAGRTIGVAPEANIYSVKIIGCDRQGYVSWVTAGVDWVLANRSGPTVVNFSFGVPTSETKTYSTLVSRLTDAGITVVTSAGNEGSDACLFEPANSESAITVGASNQQDEVAAYSNTGACVDIFAPGSNNLVATAYSDTSFDTSHTGTSLASPYVAGAAALYLQHRPDATPSMVRLHLLHGSTTVDALSGVAGSPNRLLYVGADDN